MQNYDEIRIVDYPSGQILRKEYRLNKLHHRIDGPAITEYFESGSIKRECYYINNQVHRTNGPARIGYKQSGKIEYEFYITKNQMHRTDGPAWVYWTEFGEILYEEYYINNKRVFIGEFVKMMRASENKTQTLYEILNDEQELRPILVKILPNMFKDRIDSNVFDNLTMFF